MKSPLRSLALATTLALALSAQASAETVTLQLSNATVDVPEGWTHKDAGNNTMALDEPNKQVNISIISTEGKNLLTVVTNVTAMLKKMMPKLKLDKGKKAAINGNVGKVFVGAGVLGPKPVKVALHVLETPDHHGLMMIQPGRGRQVQGPQQDRRRHHRQPQAAGDRARPHPGTTP